MIWNLDSVYTDIESPQYLSNMERLKALCDDFFKALAKMQEGGDQESGNIESAPFLNLLKTYEDAGNIAENLSAYAQAVWTCDTQNQKAMAAINAVDSAKLPLSKATVMLRSFLAQHKTQVQKIALSNEAASYRFFIEESIKKAAFQMDAAAEDLANDLSRSGGDAWSHLHDALCASAGADFMGQRKTLNELRSLAHSADRDVRKNAYLAEIEACKAIEIPAAACLNGVKGWSITLDERRKWESPLAKAAFQSRISCKTLDALIAAMEFSLPMFKRYLKAKAKLINEKLSFYDIFAPVGDTSNIKKYSWEEACDFVVERFAEFDPKMADFARSAYEKNWVDAKMRANKIGGAYCTDFPLARESRILCNFDGSFDSVCTLAHETGHAWHHEIVKNLSSLEAAYPMSLAETASTFAETIIFEGALKASCPEEKIVLLEENLQNSCQLIVDILSRFYFEKAVFERRKTGELSSEDFCAMMLDAQKKTYGDALNEAELHPYMWAVKVHYYSPSLAFYNFPYAFGCLFSLSLYAKAKKEGPSFAAEYRDLLSWSGKASAEDVAKRAGFDIEKAEFWQNALDIIKINIEKFESMVNSFLRSAA